MLIINTCYIRLILSILSPLAWSLMVRMLATPWCPSTTLLPIRCWHSWPPHCKQTRKSVKFISYLLLLARFFILKISIEVFYQKNLIFFFIFLTSLLCDKGGGILSQRFSCILNFYLISPSPRLGKNKFQEICRKFVDMISYWTHPYIHRYRHTLS